MVAFSFHKDVPTTLAAYEQMRGRIQQFPLESRRAWDLGQSWGIPSSLRGPRQVVVCGMGGSSIGGAFLRVATRHRIAVHLAQDYSLPPCDPDTLVIASSFSGNTEETIAAIQSLEARSAMKLVLSTGGRLSKIADGIGAAVMTYESDGPPRTAWEYGFLPILALLGRLGVLQDDGREVETVLDVLAEQASILESFARVVAPRLADRIPFVVGTEHLAPVARRWAGQLNENSKRVAFFGELPEINHNFLLGFTDHLTASIDVVLLDSDLLSDRARSRIDLTERLLKDQRISFERVVIPGECELDSMLRGALVGDWISWWLAFAGGVNPMDTSALEDFKAELAVAPPRLSPAAVPIR